MTSYKQADVVLIQFPFTDLTAAKKRPAVIISNNKYNHSEDRILVAVTSSRAFDNTSDFILPEQERKNTGLLKPSTIKCGKIFTVKNDLILKKIGILSDTVLRDIKEKINSLM